MKKAIVLIYTCLAAAIIMFAYAYMDMKENAWPKECELCGAHVTDYWNIENDYKGRINVCEFCYQGALEEDKANGYN